MKFIKTSNILLLVIALIFCANSHAASPPKNIILMIGDGMGITQITATRYKHGKLNLDRFSNIALMTIHSRHTIVTDSAASATALATGRKIRNKHVSFYKGERFKTLLEYALDAKMGTGLVVTSSIVHATPAAFASHVDHREKKRSIARQLARSGIHLMMGGGRKYFYPINNPKAKKKQVDLLSEMAKRYKIVRKFSQLKGKEKEPYILALFNRKQIPRAKNRSYGLDEMTDFALKNLTQHPNGFAVMIEGSQIDWAGHTQNSEMIMQEVWDFDKAVGKALDFYQQHPDTLLVVTADHETGGYSIIDGNMEDKAITKTQFATTKHTGQMVPVFSIGPGSDKLRGILDNALVGQILIDLIKAKITASSGT